MDNSEEVLNSSIENGAKLENDQETSENNSKDDNSFGIPSATFVEDMTDFMILPENDNNAEKVIRRLDEQHSKYKFMEYSLMAKKKRLRSQIPDLEQTVSTIKLLEEYKSKKEKESIICDFLVSEQVYAKAKVFSTDTVYLWLGANVMLEYPLHEATALLTKNIDNAKKNVERIEHQLDFLRDQRTVTEVTMARVYNWDIKKRQLEDEPSSSANNTV